MKLSSALVVLIFFTHGSWGQGAQVARSPPSWTSSYTVDAIIELPYAEIKEPFRGYYDAQNGRSRVDYYGDLVQTVQRADVTIGDVTGISYKVAWMTDPSGKPMRVCFQVNGSTDSPVTPTSVLPDASGFKYQGSDNCPGDFPVVKGASVEGLVCDKWVSSSAVGEKESKYTLWTTSGPSGPVPVHYEMKGYNSLLGSHYDEYKVTYANYVETTPESKVFDLASNYTCRSFPGPGHQVVALHDPIREFIGGHDTHHDVEFEKFKAKHGRQYEHALIHQQKKDIFRHNYRYILSGNRKNVHYKMAINHLTDFTPNELQYLRGRLSSTGSNGGKAFDKTNMKDAPDSLDWRLFGAVNPVKDQAVCGSCWSFGTTGTIEGTYFVKTGHLVRLSEQQLIDCSWQQGDNGCDGGEDFRAYGYVMRAGGLTLDEEYGGYLGQDGKCHDTDVPLTIQLDGFVNVTSYDPEALQVALFNNGPVTIGIDASQKSFSFYSNGVYYDPNCGSTPEALDHQVLAVGYGTLYGQRYWLVKNSWSTYWGNDGYILMAQKDNNCGVMTSPTYPLIKA
ncbi:Counting factor associated protein D [Halotydeus destructor]|nr:Counting factor associated protein D [Halotydeus destructor]